MKKDINKKRETDLPKNSRRRIDKKTVKKPVKTDRQSDKIQIIPLGGLDKIGMNITAIRYKDNIVVIDCGISFPESDMLGIDKVIPDITYLLENERMVKGFFITHGHEDHIGALPYILPQLPVPVYGTKLTLGLIKNKLEEANIADKARLREVAPGDRIRVGDLRVEFIKTNHSIPGACAIAVKTPIGTVFHTGDFKVDYTPLFGDAIDLQRIAEIGKEGVIALLSDSTNAMREGFTPSEIMVAKTFDRLFAENSKNRIIVATFSSNLDRVQQLINTAKKYNRKVILQGRSMENTISTAQELGYLKIPGGTMIGIDEMNDYPDSKLVFITTGSQGEAMAALSRMAGGEHKKVSIKPGDVIVFSSNPIPGNERAVTKVMNELADRGAKVVYQDTHVSGHACKQELELMYSLLKPVYAIPVHGEYRHLMANAAIAEELGVPKGRIFVLEAGDVLSLSAKAGKVIDKVTAREIYVDGLGVGDVGVSVIKDRQSLSASGFILVALVREKHSGMFIAGPEIITRGFVYVKESGDIMEEMRGVALDSIDYCYQKKIRETVKIRSVIKKDMEEYLWERFQRNPIVIPVILETNY